MERVHGVVHGPGSMFCIRPLYTVLLHVIVKKIHKGLKLVTCVQCSWIFIFLGTTFGNAKS